MVNLNQIQSHDAFWNEMQTELGLPGQVLYCAAAGDQFESATPSDCVLEGTWALGVAILLNHWWQPDQSSSSWSRLEATALASKTKIMISLELIQPSI